MKIGIVVHSKTGHTLSVANKIRDHFRIAGQDVDLLAITATNDQEMNVNSIILTNQPQIDGYSVLICRRRDIIDQWSKMIRR